ncbi:YbfB/YjiJ family MFS transporter [Bacillus cytotoxicus]|uniref:YbfB/YjiJ family MFS transporter n=1 Tax=Bacillus cereus group sp. BfR-BA-01492 TaxID=2920361 RepID=UPI001F5854CA|nr:YbfB/YjiJ family MFS transporter [Bacillus cereus group sp. BfR-BA-01492]EMA6343770.1 YbfB/YjiJ family MFS transporter [Bacillus cytotoxicus]
MNETNIWKMIVAGIFSLIAVMGINRFAYTPIISFMEKQVHVEADLAGYLASSNYLGYLLGAFFIGFRTIMNREKVLHYCLLLNVLSTIFMGFTSSIAIWFSLRFIGGFTSAIVFVLASSIVLDYLFQRNKVMLSGMIYSGVGMGIICAGVFAPLFNSTSNWQGAWIGLGLISFCLTIFVWKWLKEDTKHTEKKSKVPSIHTNHRKNYLFWLILAYGFEGFGYIITGTFLVTIVERMTHSLFYASCSWIIVGIAVIPSSYLWSSLAQKYGTTRTLTFAYILQMISILSPLLLPNVLGAFLSALFLGGTFVGITILTTTEAKRIKPNESNKIIGYTTGVYGIGQIIGPILTGVIAKQTDSFFLPLLIAALTLFIAILLLFIGEIRCKQAAKNCLSVQDSL